VPGAEQRCATRALSALAAALLATAGLLAGVATPAGAAPDAHDVQNRVLAGEVCEPTARDAAVAAARRDLTEAPRGTWRGARFTCRYDFGDGGVLLARVRVYDDTADARDAFAYQRRAHRSAVKLFGLGSGAFKVGGSLLVAHKDNFVLTVDGRMLAKDVGPDVVVFSTTRAVFDCW
jgi:hypothetical protein